MYELKVGEKAYQIKYAYTATVKAKLIPKLTHVEFQKDINSADDFFASAQETMELLPEALLVGLQTYHKDEFGYNYETNEGKDEAIEKINGILDELFSDENVNCFDVYTNLLNELMENGFLKQMFLNLMDKLKEVQNEQEKASKKSSKSKN